MNFDVNNCIHSIIFIDEYWFNLKVLCNRHSPIFIIDSLPINVELYNTKDENHLRYYVSMYIWILVVIYEQSIKNINPVISTY